MISVKQAAKSLRVSEAVVYSLIQSRALCAKKRGCAWQITRLPVEKPVTIQIIASTLQISPRRVRVIVSNLHDRGALKAAKIGRQWRIDLSDALKLIDIRK
jgi:predicted DNA-binding transcriptional regulator